MVRRVHGPEDAAVTESDREPGADDYRLPQVRDRLTRQMRPMTIQEMRARNAPVKEESVHDW